MDCEHGCGGVWVSAPYDIAPSRIPAKYPFSRKYNPDGICGALGPLDQGFSEGSDMVGRCVARWISTKGEWGEEGKRGKLKGPRCSLEGSEGGQWIINVQGLDWRGRVCAEQKTSDHPQLLCGNICGWDQVWTETWSNGHLESPAPVHLTFQNRYP